MKEINLEIITPSRSVFNRNVISVTFPGSLGEFQVLHDHAALISIIEIGRIKVETAEGETIYIATSGGSVEVKDNKVLFLAETAEIVDDIDIDRAKKSAERAKERLQSANKDSVDFTRAETSLSRAMNRLKIKGIVNN